MRKIIEEVIEAVKYGQWGEAKKITQRRCKTRPEVQAYRVGRIVGALCDPDGFHKRPDLAVRFLELFRGDQ